MYIAVLNENGTGVAGHRPVLGSGKFLYAYGTQANVNQVGLLYLIVVLMLAIWL